MEKRYKDGSLCLLSSRDYMATSSQAARASGLSYTAYCLFNPDHLLAQARKDLIAATDEMKRCGHYLERQVLFSYLDESQK
jgi:hypothetical protein